MAFDGSGTYNRIHNWQQDAANGLNISAPEMDGEDNSIAGAFNLAVTRDGQGKMTADFLPNADNTLNLGSATKRWAQLNGVPVVNLPTTQANVGLLLYPQSSAEASAVITPTFYYYPPFDARRYGADPLNLADSTTPIVNGLAVCAVNGGTLVGLLGTFKISSTITINANNVYLQGQGQAVSTLSFTNATGDLLAFGNGVANPNFVGVSKLTITAAVSKSAGAAIKATNVTYLWLQDIQLNSNLFTGFQLDGGASQLFYFLDRFAINSGTNGILIGTAGNAQEVRISNGIMAKQATLGVGIYQASGTYLSRIAVAGGIGVLLNPGNGQKIQAAYFDQVISDGCTTNGWLFSPTGTGVITSVSMVACWGSSSTGAASQGLTIASGGTIKGVSLTNFKAINNQGTGGSIGAGKGICLTNCTFAGNSQGGNGTYHGLYCNQVTELSVIGGFYGDYDAITNKQGYGLLFDTNCVAYSVFGAMCFGNITGPILDVAAVGTIIGCPPFSKSNGWGTPTGGGVIANFPGATATLAQTSQTVAQILLALKSLGLINT